MARRAARKELRAARRQLAQEELDLSRVRRAGGEGIALVWRCKQELARLAAELDALRAHARGLEQAREADEAVRRRLHNTVQALKGNIRVFCRIRPALGEREAAHGAVHSAVQMLSRLPGTSRGKYSCTRIYNTGTCKSYAVQSRQY